MHLATIRPAHVMVSGKERVRGLEAEEHDMDMVIANCGKVWGLSGWRKSMINLKNQ